MSGIKVEGERYGPSDAFLTCAVAAEFACRARRAKFGRGAAAEGAGLAGRAFRGGCRLLSFGASGSRAIATAVATAVATTASVASRGATAAAAKLLELPNSHRHIGGLASTAPSVAQIFVSQGLVRAGKVGGALRARHGLSVRGSNREVRKPVVAVVADTGVVRRASSAAVATAIATTCRPSPILHLFRK